ncbi:MAG: DoxX family membrane protein [Caulobacteraceae bacterium]|nr:DoxX family membrane protein [Caulobacteraceae bacterium]
MARGVGEPAGGGLGVRVYGLGAVALGIAQVGFGSFSPDWLPVPRTITGYSIILDATATVLALAGVAAILARPLAPLALALVFATGLILIHAPQAAAAPAEWVSWQAIAESAAMALGGMIAGLSPFPHRHARSIARWLRRAFGLCLIVFGISHFVYSSQTASLVPAWLPPSRLFWAHVTGLAQIAAGAAMLTGQGVRLAATLLTAMYLIFAVLVHLPAILARPHDPDVWTENAINLVLVGVAWSFRDASAAGRDP